MGGDGTPLIENTLKKQSSKEVTGNVILNYEYETKELEPYLSDDAVSTRIQ